MTGGKTALQYWIKRLVEHTAIAPLMTMDFCVRMIEAAAVAVVDDSVEVGADRRRLVLASEDR